MRSVYMWLLIGVLSGASAAVAQAPQPQMSPAIVHRTACSLGESMASKLGSNKKIEPDAALRACQQLAPDMNDKDHAEFMRCCTERFQK